MLSQILSLGFKVSFYVCILQMSLNVTLSFEFHFGSNLSVSFGHYEELKNRNIKHWTNHRITESVHFYFYGSTSRVILEHTTQDCLQAVVEYLQ